MKNISYEVNNNICMGCGACVDTCPVKAIKFEFDETDWHLHPVVDETKCINCGKCVSVCPAKNEKTIENFKTFGFAAVAKDDIRKKSSSGGMFYTLANYILSKKGFVAGVVFDDKLTAKHIISNKIEDIVNMCGSKYVQSNPSGIYLEVEKLLKKDKLVLFSGTPCQIAGLRKFISKVYKNLLCVDIFCHGTPSPKVFDFYLSENFDKTKISNIIFRNKAHRNGTPGSLTVVMKDKKEFYSEYFDNSYLTAFSQRLAQRESCFNCKFAEFPRVGDISIGDFWNAKNTKTKIDFQNGCSIIIINSKKGEEVWSDIKKQLNKIEQYSLDELVAWNRNKAEIKPNTNFRDLPKFIKKHNSLRMAVRYLNEDKYDVGVFGTTMNPNFGGLITYWALYEVISKMGYRTVIINKPVFNESVKQITHSTEFFKENCNVTKFYKPNELSELNKIIDKFVLGSDQVWNHNLFNCWDMSLYLDFVDNNKMKISYASSFGHSYHDIKEEKKGHASKNFKLFDYIGVRESDGVNILKNDYNVEAVHVMDPVFLVNKSRYIELSNNSYVDTTQRYVGSYIIEPNEFKLAVIKEIVNKLKIDNLNTTDGNRKLFASKSKWFKDRGMHIQSEATIYDWLKIIINSDFVVTDSYHATCFCIMFNKPFILLQERWALSRIESIMNLFGLHERWVKVNKIEDFKINQNWFNQLTPFLEEKLLIQVEKSKHWLKNALESSKTVIENSNITPLFNYVRVEDYFYFLMQNRKNYILIVSSSNINKNILSKIDFKCKLSFMEFTTEESSSFAFLYDYDKDYFMLQNKNTIEMKYEYYDKQIICLVDNLNPKTNNIYVNGKIREFSKLSTEAGVVISIYSKEIGKVVDSFEVSLVNNVPHIKR